MTPTARFRWLTPKDVTFSARLSNLVRHPSFILNPNGDGIRIRVLQQWWKRDGTGPDGTPGLGEWRDVPIVEEE